MNKFLATSALVLVSGAAYAESAAQAVVLGGQIETVIAETGSDDKWGATTSFELNADMASGLAMGRMDLVTDADNDLTLNEWSFGTTVGGVAMSWGKQGNIWIDTEAGSTIEEPTMGESLQLSVGNASVGFGLTDSSVDVTDLANIQASATVDAGILAVTAAGDYNLDSEEWVLAGRADTAGMLDGVRLGGAVSYGSLSETIGLEADATVMGVTAYVSGDQDDLAQHVGGSYGYDLSGVLLEGAVDYDIDAENVTPKITATFSF